MLKTNHLAIFLSLFLVLSSCTTDNNEDENKIDKTANLQGLGDSANDLLSDQRYTSMNIEIAYVTGYGPSPEAIAQFENFLQDRVYKPDGIQINMRAVQSSGKAPFDIEEIAAIEKDTRSLYNVGDEIAVFIYFADGSSEKDEDNRFVLGSAFRNTSMVIYGETIKDFANRPKAPSKADIEAATLNHEFGHLFGLVDLGTEPQSDHKDEEYAGHCNVSGCLMQASIEFGSGILDVIDGGNVPGLDDQCIFDLQNNGGK
ncbi:MAG TPA: hypothetical protein VIM94_05330 [Salegentibacter sp.]|uniref:hypothetical protein n=1 Tax=Salegentibacter sp. TaxID=1903072 RepID=UPI002F944EFA